MNLEVRYARSFLQDLKHLEKAAYQRVYNFVFDEFMQVNQIQDLPGLHRLGSETIFYRFNLDNYLIGIEVTGHIVKFLRILSKPDL